MKKHLTAVYVEYARSFIVKNLKNSLCKSNSTALVYILKFDLFLNENYLEIFMSRRYVKIVDACDQQSSYLSLSHASPKLNKTLQEILSNLNRKSG